jgi:uncharacterized protein
MRFIDRESELALLQEHLQRKGAGLFVLYGRRRIGKTALIERALQGHGEAAYHVGTRSTLVEELARLSLTLARAWDIPLLETQPLRSVQALLDLLAMVQGPRLLALDELPYLVESEPAFPGLLQTAWDARLSRTSLKLLVCGSSIAMMENLFLSRRGPLFGRRTGQLRLGPLPPSCLSEWFPWKQPELIELAAVFGGIPGHLAHLDSSLDLRGNLERRVLARGEPLYEEVPFLLREELREPHVYQAVLATVASGATRFGEISSKVGLDRANLSRYLSTLGDLGLVEREVPITERAPDKSRKGRYRIADPFVSTWYSFVHPHRNRLERGRSGEVMRDEVLPRFGSWIGRAVEPVLTIMLAQSKVVPFEVAFAGRYWSADVELDVVLLDSARQRAFIGEVKWGSRPVGRGAMDDLRIRATRCPELGGLDLTFGLVSRAGFVGKRRRRPDERFIDARKRMA